MYKLVFILLFSSISNTLWAQQSSESFTVRMFDSYIQVLAPTHIYPEQSVIIENKTMTKVLARLQSPTGANARYLSIGPGQFKSVNIPTKGIERLIFVPLSPAFQEVELKIGMPSYEIPAQR